MISRHTFLGLLFLIFCFFTVTPSPVHAAVGYVVEYSARDRKQLRTPVRYTISISEGKTTVTSNSFSLTLPISFQITNIRAVVDGESVEPQLSSQQNQMLMTIPIPQSEKRDEHQIVLTFLQSNIVHTSNEHTEILIPSILLKKEDHAEYRVTIPHQSLAMSNPPFSKRADDVVIWNTSSGKTLQLLLGAPEKKFRMYLIYHMENTSPTIKKLAITLPPESAYQKLSNISLSETPESTRVDEDDNVLAYYSIAPHSLKRVEYSSDVTLSLKPNTDSISYERDRLRHQQQFLQSFIGSEYRTPKITNASAIYEYVLAALQYDYRQLSASVTRATHRSASVILSEPDRSVCLDYSGLFVHLARKNGIKAREVIGYAIDTDEQLRPTLGDELHTWAEFSTADDTWSRLDPTWGDTSSLNYFDFKDLSHIALAYHGAQSDLPQPAGFYRSSKDSHTSLISIGPISSVQPSSPSLSIRLKSSTKLRAGLEEMNVFTVTNTGHEVVYDLPVRSQLDTKLLQPRSPKINRLYPYQSVDVTVPAKISQNMLGSHKISFSVGSFHQETSITVLPRSYSATMKIAITLLSLLLVIVFIWKWLRR